MTANSDFTPPADPWILFREWYALAEKSEPSDPDAMALATVGADGHPSLRIVLLKSHEDGKLVFFTNRKSRKGEELAHNPRAAICLHWKSLDRQIRAEGPVSLLADAESNAYFSTRPRGSQIGAWASRQSKVLESRAALERAMKETEQHYAGHTVPRPPFWGGYGLMPLRLEFWQERPFRLHDRIVYHRPRADAAWTIERLYP
jgi:pyridoxamine 5'-phosphate oxidase